jgi:chemotaxis family two-component system response regulator Rcp1
LLFELRPSHAKVPYLFAASLLHLDGLNVRVEQEYPSMTQSLLCTTLAPRVEFAMTKNRPQRPIEILLVEDSPDDADLMEDALRDGQLCVLVHKVEDGVEALDYLRRQGAYEHASRPDLILLDLHLPRKNGHEVLAELKQDETLRFIPIVILTASRNATDIDTAWDLHANCCVPKPIDAEQFTQTVKIIEQFWLTTASRAWCPNRPDRSEASEPDLEE